MELKVWWDEDSDEPTFVRTLEDLEALRVQASASTYPVVFEMLDASEPHRVILDAGFFGDRGVLYYSGGEHRHGLYSMNPDDEFSAPENRLYHYMSSDREFPKTAEYPVDVVWQACREFMDSDGSLPSAVAWQSASVMSGNTEA